MTASTTTTIRGVSIFSRQRRRTADVFDIALSPEGIAIQRPGRAEQYMGWDRISEWELAERPDCVVLTLRGGGSVTPLMVKGWAVDDLETVMRETAAGSRGPTTTAAKPTAASRAERVPASDAPSAAGPVAPRAARRQAARRPRRLWRAVVTVVLLGAAAAAVVLILLQSAGVISWSFLGPTA